MQMTHTKQSDSHHCCTQIAVQYIWKVTYLFLGAKVWIHGKVYLVHEALNHGDGVGLEHLVEHVVGEAGDLEALSMLP